MSSKRIFKNTAAALLAVAVFFCACSKKPTQEDSAKLKVTVSSYAVYAIAQEALRGIADIEMLLPPGAGAHHFEPGPQTAVAIHNADFFFYISPRMEPWADKLSQSKGIALAYDLPGNSKDPHVWMSFNNASIMANHIAMYIARKHPELEKQLAANIASFNKELDMIDRMYSQTLYNCKTRDVYHIGHNAFGYPAAQYKLNFKPLSGALAEAEPSPKEMALMIKEIKNKKISFIFTEEELNPKLAAAISSEAGAQELLLYTIEHVSKEQFKNKTTYKQFMVMNLNNLKQGLGCTLD